MSITKIATRYARSLIELAVEGKKLDRILEDVQSFQKACENRDFQLMIKSPIINQEKKQDIVNQLFSGKYDELTMSFFKILINKGRENYLPDIAREFINQYKKINHISTVKLTTATKLTDAAVKAVREKLIESGAVDTNVELITKVQEGLLGGFILEFDDKIYDASVQHKLDNLKKEFADNLYISQIVAK